MPLYNIIVSILTSLPLPITRGSKVYPIPNPDLESGLTDGRFQLNYDNHDFIICIPIPENEECKWFNDEV